jgi:RNA polymerase sigma-70 factor (ECF subfamily)
VESGLSGRDVEGRASAFAVHVLPQVEVLYRVARSLTGQSADAEDLVQETLLRAFRSIERFDGRHPRAWLLTILRNTEHNRHRRRRPVLLDDPDDIGEHGSPGARERVSSPEELLVDASFDAAVEAAVRALPLRYREVVALVDVQGLGYADAAAVLGVPVGTVTSRLHRARKQIRVRLAEAGMTPEGGE